MKKKRLLAFLIVLGIFIIACLWLWKNKADAPKQPYRTVKTQKTPEATPVFDKKQYSINDADSIWVIVNKKRPLPDNYRPNDLVVPNVALRTGSGHEEMLLRQVAASALEKLFAAAESAGRPLRLASGFRSQQYQIGLFYGYVKTIGLQQAELSSARPGHSEHQTGLTADLEPFNRACEIQRCFADTTAGQWLAANAYKYGFVIRYPENKTDITGYEFEPWHFRYVGVNLATEMRKQKIKTLEEFFNLPAAPSY